MKEVSTWARVELQQFESVYKKAVAEDADTFVFDGHEFVTNYAKYLIEYLEGLLK